VYTTFWKTRVVAPGSQAPGNIIIPADIITFWDVLLPRWRELCTAWKCDIIALTELGFHMILSETSLLIDHNYTHDTAAHRLFGSRKTCVFAFSSRKRDLNFDRLLKHYTSM